MGIQNSIDMSRVRDSATSQGAWDKGETRTTGLTNLDVVVVRDGESSWHGLETQAPPEASLEDWARIAGFDQWKIVMRRAYMPNPGYRTIDRLGDVYVAKEDFSEVPGTRVITRWGPGDYLEVFGVASDQYKPVQPLDQIAVVRRFMEAGDVKLNTMGSLFAGRKVWALLDLGVSWRVNGTDEVKGMLAIMNANDGTGAFKVKLTMLRIVCSNTYRRAGAGASAVSLTHRTSWSETTPQEIVELTGLAREQAKEEQAAAQAMADTHMSEEQVYEYVARVSGSADAFRTITGKPVAEIDGGSVLNRIMENHEMAADFEETTVDPSKLNRIGKRILDHMLAGTPGSVALTDKGLSAWDAFNHTTYYTSHDKRVGRSAARRVDSALDGTAEALGVRASRVLNETVMQHAARA